MFISRQSLFTLAGVSLMAAGGVSAGVFASVSAGANSPALPPTPSLSPGTHTAGNASPGTFQPPRLVTQTERVGAQTILSSSSVLKDKIGPQSVSIGRVVPWNDGTTGRAVGVAMEVNWPGAVHFEPGLPQPIPTPGSKLGYVDGTNDVAFSNVTTAWIFVDLGRQLVVGIKPDPLQNHPIILPTTKLALPSD